MFNILVLCTGNSARSILAEALLNRDGAERVRAWSAGSNPTGQVNPAALRALAHAGLQTSGYRSKSWVEFAAPGAPRMDAVITLCQATAAETCPFWPGAPVCGHWAMDDPATAPPDQIDLAFRAALDRLGRRSAALLALPLEDMSPGVLSRQLARIGEHS